MEGIPQVQTQEKKPSNPSNALECLSTQPRISNNVKASFKSILESMLLVENGYRAGEINEEKLRREGTIQCDPGVSALAMANILNEEFSRIGPGTLFRSSLSPTGKLVHVRWEKETMGFYAENGSTADRDANIIGPSVQEEYNNFVELLNLSQGATQQ